MIVILLVFEIKYINMILDANENDYISELNNLPTRIQKSILLQKITTVPVLKPINILIIAEKSAGLKLAQWLYSNYPNILYYQNTNKHSTYIKYNEEPNLAIFDNIYKNGLLNTYQLYNSFHKLNINPAHKKETDAPILTIITTESGEIEDSTAIREEVNLSAGVYSTFDLIYTLHNDECNLDTDELDVITEDNMSNIRTQSAQLYSEDNYDKPFGGSISYLKEEYDNIREKDDFNYIPKPAFEVQPWLTISEAFAVMNNSEYISQTELQQSKKIIFKSLEDINYCNLQ